MKRSWLFALPYLFVPAILFARSLTMRPVPPSRSVPPPPGLAGAWSGLYPTQEGTRFSVRFLFNEHGAFQVQAQDEQSALVQQQGRYIVQSGMLVAGWLPAELILGKHHVRFPSYLVFGQQGDDLTPLPAGASNQRLVQAGIGVFGRHQTIWSDR